MVEDSENVGFVKFPRDWYPGKSKNFPLLGDFGRMKRVRESFPVIVARVPSKLALKALFNGS